MKKTVLITMAVILLGAAMYMGISRKECEL